MRIAHTADVHLGFRAHTRNNANGVNQREADVALSFRRFIDAALAAQVRVILIAGDLFHRSNPGNLAIVECNRQVRRATEAGVVVLLVGGNHDTPKLVEHGSIMPLYASVPGAFAAWQHPASTVVDGVTFTLVPHVAVAEGRVPPPEPVGRNVLVIHGAVPGCYQRGHFRDAAEWDAAKFSSGWDYVALGDYHVHRQVAPNAWYSGSLDFVSTDPWSELREARDRGLAAPKGWTLVDLDLTGQATVTFMPLTPSREFLDLPKLDTNDHRLVDEALHGLAPLEVDGKVVRLVVENFPRLERREIDHEHLRALRNRALHFNLDMRIPARRKPQYIETADLCEACGHPYEDRDGNCARCGACGFCRGSGEQCPRCEDQEAPEGPVMLFHEEYAALARETRDSLHREIEDPYGA